MRLLLSLWMMYFSQMAFAQCDDLFAEPEFGLENTWLPQSKSYVQEVSFKKVCAKRSTCYLKNGSVRDQCDEEYHDNLEAVCKAEYPYKNKLYGRCMKKINKAAKLVKLEGAQYFRSQKRKADQEKRESNRKLRAEKRRDGFLRRAEERRDKRLGR